MSKIDTIEKKVGGAYDDASATKLLMVNGIIEAYNQTGWKLTKDDPIVKIILENSFMGCVDCGLSDCICPENGVPYEEALVELRDAVEYEIDNCLGRTDAHAVKKYYIEQGWALA